MNIGDFFRAAPHARPINPRQVRFTAVSRADVLPGGTPNPSRRPVAAAVTAAMVFIGGNGALEARLETRKYLQSKGLDAAQGQGEEYFLELTYQILARVLHEWDEKEARLGGPLFPNVELVRELIEAPEATRMLRAYNQYVSDEHPSDDTKEGVANSPSNFPKVG